MNRVKRWITRLTEAVRRSAKVMVEALTDAFWALNEAGKAVKEHAMKRELERARERGLDPESIRELEREHERRRERGRERIRELEGKLEREHERSRELKRERALQGSDRWWEHPPRGRVGTHIGQYDDPVRMDAEVTSASTFGWTVKNASATGSHINVGRTVTPAVLTGGLSLLLGASRTKEKYIVTFEHDGRVAEE